MKSKHHPTWVSLGAVFVAVLITWPVVGQDSGQAGEKEEEGQGSTEPENGSSAAVESVLLEASRKFGEHLANRNKEGLSRYITPTDPLEVVTQCEGFQDHECENTRRFLNRQAFYRWLDRLPLDPDEIPFNPVVVGESGKCEGSCCSLWREEGAGHGTISLYMVCFAPYGEGARIAKIGLSYD